MIDDIIVSGRDDKDHMQNLEAVLNRQTSRAHHTIKEIETVSGRSTVFGIQAEQRKSITGG